ncbi:DUF11 domain-containing protein [Psychromonas sp. CD1]|uniref:DUF11 domain-containing protein n=1 Tax=Psychromonas sp. CD1 TaxID=1979839 RepID=UPI002150E159|nr:DUF11 domain-containing protein [Psychromonas sp. CD1]
MILSVAKTADKKAYTNDDTQVIYTLKVYNRGSSDVDNVLFEDKITQLQGSHGKPLFTDWISTIKEMPSGVIIATQKNSDLSSTQTLKAYAENSFVITIVGTIAKGLDNDITNIFTARTPNGEKSSTSVRIHVKKYTDNEGQLLVYKRALKNSIKVGEVVEYEVIIENHNESEFRNIILEDRYPAGFKYVPDSVEMTHSGSDGTFDTHDDTITSAEPSVSNVLSFKIGDLLINNYQDKNVHEKIRIRYLLRASLGTTFGKYINTAYALAFLPTRSSGTRQIVSNLSSATVSITADKFFDTASIIGKVFEDHNQDGYQADATATNIRIHVDLMPSIYIQGSTTITHNNQERKSNSILDGIKIKKLMGLSLNRTLLESNKAILKFSSLTLQSFAFTITTDAGSHISFSKDNQIKVAHRGKKVKGLSAERLNVTRTLYQDGQTYLWEIVVENIGIYEDGIPGIKLLTVDGIIIETDEYGRYHLPDQWVLNKKGKQTLIKLDSDSLPAGMHVISENPKVLRISPYKLTKFNFSVHLKINRGLEK